MPDSSDIAPIATLIGDRARAAILMTLMGGQALTATELARAAGITKQTASSHLAKLMDGRLVAVEQVGRHRYFQLAGDHVGNVIEQLMVLAHRTGAPRVASGPADPAMRKARTCYDHLAGELGVLVYDSLRQQGFLRAGADELALTDDGRKFCERFDIDLGALAASRRPLCLPCLDWSVRRHHLAGALGAAILEQCLTLRWARRHRSTRVVSFSALGERALRGRFKYRPI
jgi:DNA-binding transcriptional ArsR family regulator